MKVFCIFIVEPISVLQARTCVESGKKWGVDVQLFAGLQGDEVNDLPIDFEPDASVGLKGCFGSHYSLWKQCIKDNEHFCILEHDAIITSPFKNLPIGDMLELCQPEKNWTNPDKAEYSIMTDAGNPRGTTGYMISPITAKKLVHAAETKKNVTHADIFMGGVLKRTNAIVPYPVKVAKIPYSTIHTVNKVKYQRQIVKGIIFDEF